MSEEPDISERQRLEEIISLCRKRHGRACDKAAGAQAELTASEKALGDAKRKLAVWVEANPDPQGSIFEELSDV